MTTMEEVFIKVGEGVSSTEQQYVKFILSTITFFIVRTKPKQTVPRQEKKIAETSLSMAEPVDLPGAIPTDSMTYEPEHNSHNVDDVSIIFDERISEFWYYMR